MNQCSRRSIGTATDGSRGTLAATTLASLLFPTASGPYRARNTGSGRPIALKEVILTPEGYEKLKQEIDYLQNDKRREVAERIRVAREFGDIAENAEYDDAKN